MAMPDPLIGSMTAEYGCPFPGCPARLAAHPQAFDAALQRHLDAEHPGFTVVGLRSEVAKSQGPSR